MPNTSPQVPYVCLSAHCEERAGTTSLARQSLMVDEWHSRCLSIFSSKHPRQAGRRGSWAHEVVQRWTVDYQFNRLNWKVKPLWGWQTQMWHFAASHWLEARHVLFMIFTENYPEFFSKSSSGPSYASVSSGFYGPHTCNSCVSWHIRRNLKFSLDQESRKRFKKCKKNREGKLKQCVELNFPHGSFICILII